MKETNSKRTWKSVQLRDVFEKGVDALTLYSVHQRVFSIKRLRSMAQQFVQMDWIGKDLFNTFIDEVYTLPSYQNLVIYFTLVRSMYQV